MALLSLSAATICTFRTNLSKNRGFGLEQVQLLLTSVECHQLFAGFWCVGNYFTVLRCTGQGDFDHCLSDDISAHLV